MLSKLKRLFCKLKWRMITQHTQEAATHMAGILRRSGVKIVDIKESTIVDVATGEVKQEIYVLCCESDEEKFNHFKEEQNLTEVQYEGFRTLC